MIPTYQRIAPAEHAIGKPVTQSLMDRMRRNPLAILGIDEDDEAPFLRMAVVARHLVAEWADNAKRLGVVHPEGKEAAYAANLLRQPALVRWIVDHLLANHATVTSRPSPNQSLSHACN